MRVFIAYSVRQCAAFVCIHLEIITLTTAWEMEGLRKGEGLILSMYPLTSCIVLQAMCMIASSRCVCACVCARVPTYWQLRDLNSLLFSLIFICYSPVLLSSCLLFPILSSHLFLCPLSLLYLISSFCLFPLSSSLLLLSSTIFHTQSRFCSITAQKNLSSMPLFRV